MRLRTLSISLVVTASAGAAFANLDDHNEITMMKGVACQPQWLTGFGDPRLNGAITSLLVHDFGDGNGPGVFAAGLFTDSEDGPLHRIARWDGLRWHPLGAGMNNSVNALAVLQTQDQDVLVAGGTFTEAGGTPALYLAQWDGSSWSGIAGGMNGPVFALAVNDDGTLIAGGSFTEAGGASAARIAQWDGGSWQSLGSGVNDTVRALAFFDDGQGAGPQLIAGGQFTVAGDAAAARVAKWDGAAWSALGAGTNNAVLTMLTLPSDQGDVLLVGGAFTEAGGVPAGRVAAWDGNEWTSPGGGVDNGQVRSLAVDVDESLLVGGSFSLAGGQATSGLTRWDGMAWSSPTGTLNGLVLAMARFEESVFLGGSFTEIVTPQPFFSVDVQEARSAAQLINDRLFSLRSGANDEVWAFEVFDDGSGPALYAAGKFRRIGATPANHVAKWDGKKWSPLGEGTDTWAVAMAVYDDGSGEALYVAGNFSEAGGVPAERIAKWDGTSWSALGSGLAFEPSLAQGLAMVVHDDGSGEALYVGGRFSTAGGVPANAIARWDGTAWSSLGSGVSGTVESLTVFDDGSGGGPALHVGGNFETAGGVPVNNIAKWDGTSWSALGSGLQRVEGGSTFANGMIVFDDGSGAGPALYATGIFDLAGGASANNIARWDGTSWSALGSGLESPTVVQSLGLSVFDDGSGLSLYVTGVFVLAGDEPASRVARWDGRSWSPLGSGLTVPSPANPGPLGGIAMTVFDDGQGLGPALYIGGAFAQAGSVSSKQIARWQGCPTPPPCPTDFNGDGATDIADLLLILAAWGSCNGCPEDLTGDGVVGIEDLFELLAAWGPCS